MIRLIFKQIWNQRRQNSWIFVEMMLVSFFLWSVIDPVYTLFADMSINPGYQEDDLYELVIKEYPSTHRKYKAECDLLDIKKDNYTKIANYIKALPEIESFVIAAYYAYPNNGSLFTMGLTNDSISTYCQKYMYSTIEGGNFFETLKLNDAYTDKIMKQQPVLNGNKEVYITKRLADLLFPSGKVVGSKLQINKNDNDSAVVVGVVNDIKHSMYEQPVPIVIFADNEIRFSSDVLLASILFRVKPSVNEAAFEEQFNKVLGPQLQLGNFYFKKIERMSNLRHVYNLENGINNIINLRFCLGVFALLCIFLGTVGTFWIRCNARRQENGLMKAMGASSKNIMKQFLLESWLLFTLAFIPAILIQLYIYRVNLLDAFRQPLNMDYIQNQPVAHFLIVTAIVYIILLLTVLLASYIPIRSAIQTLPSNALRDE